MKQTALVTGAGGFIGSHLVAALLARDWEVRALVRYNSRAGWGWLEGLRGGEAPGLEVRLGDVADADALRQAVAGCDVIFHLAALIGVPYSYEAARSYFETNTLGTLNLARAALDHGTRRFVHISTSEVYGTARRVPIDEDHPLQAQSPYAASKIGADKVIESCVASFGLPAVTVRPFNTFGPRQSARAVIPTILAQALAGGEVRLGSLDPVRDLTFVSDTVAGMIAAGEADGAVGEVFNLGTGEGVTIGELARLIFEVLGVECRITLDPERVRPAASEALKLVSDNRRAAAGLGWRPAVPLREGLVRTAAWMREHRSLYHPGEYTR